MPLSVEDAFAFYGERQPRAITPPWLRFRILDPRPGRAVGRRAPRVLAGPAPLPVRWTTEIDIWEPPHRFVDFQVRGPYRIWEHTHTFEPVEGGTLMTDRIRYAIPYGPLGIARARRVRAPRPAPDLRLPPRCGCGAAGRWRRYPFAALPASPSDRSAVVAAALAAAVAAAAPRREPPGRRRAEPVHRPTRRAAALPGPPDGHAGGPVPRPLRGPQGPARDEQPQEPGRGAGHAARNAHRASARCAPASTSTASTASRLVESTGARALLQAHPRPGPRTGSGPTPRASSCGRSTARGTASGSCAPGRRWSTACGT